MKGLEGARISICAALSIVSFFGATVSVDWKGMAYAAVLALLAIAWRPR